MGQLDWVSLQEILDTHLCIEMDAQMIDKTNRSKENARILSGLVVRWMGCDLGEARVRSVIVQWHHTNKLMNYFILLNSASCMNGEAPFPTASHHNGR